MGLFSNPKGGLFGRYKIDFSALVGTAAQMAGFNNSLNSANLTDVNTSPYTTLVTDHNILVHVNAVGGPVTINFDTDLADWPLGTTKIFNDADDNCAARNITLNAGAGNTILYYSAAQTAVMNQDSMVMAVLRETATLFKVQ